MHQVIFWVEFENVLGIDELSNKADIKLTVEGDSKKIEIVSQLDLKSGYEFEFDEYGEYCISLENDLFNFKENFVFEQETTDIEITVHDNQFNA